VEWRSAVNELAPAAAVQTVRHNENRVRSFQHKRRFLLRQRCLLACWRAADACGAINACVVAVVEPGIVHSLLEQVTWVHSRERVGGTSVEPSGFFR
jgi:hypothetical protein